MKVAACPMHDTSWFGSYFRVGHSAESPLEALSYPLNYPLDRSDGQGAANPTVRNSVEFGTRTATAYMDKSSTWTAPTNTL